MKTIIKQLEKSNYQDKSFANDFDNIILSHCDNYGKNKPALKSFFEDLQKGGCISGLIGEFIYHNDCKEFYIKHIDDLENFKTELEDQIGCAIRDNNNLPHYTFMVWLAFEEYCYDIYNKAFES